MARQLSGPLLRCQALKISTYPRYCRTLQGARDLDVYKAAHRIVQMGAESVIMSLGSRGAVGATGTRVVEAVPPMIDAICAIGAGDALAAAFVWALSENKPFDDAVRWGVACGTASAALPGISFPTFAQTEKMHSRVELRVVSA